MSPKLNANERLPFLDKDVLKRERPQARKERIMYHGEDREKFCY